MKTRKDCFVVLEQVNRTISNPITHSLIIFIAHFLPQRAGNLSLLAAFHASNDERFDSLFNCMYESFLCQAQNLWIEIKLMAAGAICMQHKLFSWT